MIPSINARRWCSVCHAQYAGSERFCTKDGGTIVAVDELSTDPRIGQTIDGRYTLRRLIGRGGMGSVYAASHVGLDRDVAIKFLLTQGDELARERFRREARVASRLVHEHVVQIFDVGTSQGVDYIVMEYVAGKDLRTLLAEEVRLEPGRAVDLARQMLRGLFAIHEAGILHRDIKPANVLLTTRERVRDHVKIADFGISKAIDSAAASLTDVGTVIGTPQFMAPEQLAGLPVDHRADLYAVGLTLYTMLAGAPPFTGTTFAKLAELHLQAPPPPLDTMCPGLPRALVNAVETALAKSPDQRFPDALAFIDALSNVPERSVEAPRADLAPATVREGRVARASAPDAKATVAERRVIAPQQDDIVATVAERRVAAPQQDEVATTARPAVETSRPASAPVRWNWSWAIVPALALVAGIVTVVLVDRHRSAATSPAPVVVATTPVVVGADAAVVVAPDVAVVVVAPDAAVVAAADAAVAVAPDAAAVVVNADAAAVVVNADAAAVVAAQHVDAAVGRRPDAGARPAIDASQTLETSANDPRAYCACEPTEGDSDPLCRSRAAPRCKCASEFDLCPTPLTQCPGCEPNRLCDVAGCDSSGLACSVPGYRKPYLQGKTHGDACTGYWGKDPNPRSGAYVCETCAGAKRRNYHGVDGDACTGYDATTGAQRTGRLGSCDDAPP